MLSKGNGFCSLVCGIVDNRDKVSKKPLLSFEIGSAALDSGSSVDWICPSSSSSSS